MPAALRGHEALLLPADLRAGREVTGSVGSTVFVARPIERPLTGAAITRFDAVVVLTRGVDTNVVGRAGPYFLLAAGITLVIAAGAAFWLARRLTRPLDEMEATARRIASGDLAARASVPRRADDEVASLAATLNTMAEQLERSRGAERAFLLSISHDLRTPLTSIRGYAEALADGTLDAGDADARQRAASVITTEANRLERLVRDLLDLSRLDAHQFSLHPSACDAADVVASAAEAFGPAAHDMGVSLTVHRDGAIAADLDADRLAQIVANLVENALKYARTTVDVDVARDGERLRLAVTDDGPGVPDDEAAHVFERLYTGRGAPGRAVGTGLGLAIVHELAVAMGGEAGITRARTDGTDGIVGTDGGACFVVEVPLGR
jgi:two-component system sensor histidine kinase BaeS